MIGNIYIVGGSDWRMTDVATNATPEIFTNLNVGIGTDNPYHELHIQGSGDTRALITSGGTGDAAMMFENASGNTWGHGIDLTNNNYVIAYNNTSDPSLTVDGILQITTAGNVGIGTTNPNGDFEVFNSNQAVSIVRGNKSTLAILGDDPNSGASETDARIILGSDGTIANNLSSLTTSPLASHGFEIALINEEPGSGLRFHDGTLDKERLRIDASGDVGIGTDNPTSDLHVFGSTSTSSIIDAAAGNGLLTLRNAGNGNWSGINFTRERNTGTNVTGGSIWMPSDTSNNGATLYLQTQTASANAGVDSALTDNNGIRLKLASQPGGVGADSAFTIEVGASERLRIDASGRVTTPSQPAALVYKDGTTQGITADAIVNYEATSYSQGGMTINANRNRITVPVAGKYMINACTSGSVTTASAGDGWKLQILRDGSVYNGSNGYPIETTGSETGQELAYTVSMVVDAAANDYFEIKIENVGSARASMSYGYFGIYLLG